MAAASSPSSYNDPPSPLAVRAEGALRAAFTHHICASPPRLRQAMEYAVFPGGARLRPTLCFAVSNALDGRNFALANAAGAALEFVHCASLVHDDLPCFDDADRRRGRAALHKVSGEPLALLAGDGLFILAFDVLACAAASAFGFTRCAELIAVLARAAGSARGLVAGQAWESEPNAPLHEYHRAKTASLFEAACALGAIVADEDPAPWAEVGEAIGLAYQFMDDVRDASGDPRVLGKPVGRDEALGRPSGVRSLGIDAAASRALGHLDHAAEIVPVCGGRDDVRSWIRDLALPFQANVPSNVAAARRSPAR
jgi:geranylgeranyl diphosphate synthase type II